MLKLTAIGHIGKDAEIKDVNGKKVIEFSIASTEKYTVNGAQQEKTTWVNCNYWSEKTGIAPYLKKGTQVYLEGTPSANAYTNKDGKIVGDIRLRIATIQLLGSKPNGASNDNTSAMNGASDFSSNASEKESDLPF